MNGYEEIEDDLTGELFRSQEMELHQIVMPGVKVIFATPRSAFSSALSGYFEAAPDSLETRQETHSGRYLSSVMAWGASSAALIFICVQDQNVAHDMTDRLLQTEAVMIHDVSTGVPSSC